MARSTVVVRITESEADALVRFLGRLDTAGPEVYVALAGEGHRDYQPIVSVLEKAKKARQRVSAKYRAYRRMPIAPMKAVR